MSRPDPRTLIDRALAAPEEGAAERAAPLLELDSLQFGDDDLDTDALCRRAVQGSAACVIVPPGDVGKAAGLLRGSAVGLSTLVNHPDGSDDLGRVVEEAEAAVAEGATELDVVIPIQSVLDGDTAVVSDMVEMLRGVVSGTRLKLVLRTDRLEAPERIAAAARAAVMAGCDMLVATDPGDDERAALEASAILLAICAEAGGRVGFKIEGTSAGKAAAYIHLLEEQCAPGWITPERVRLAFRP